MTTVAQLRQAALALPETTEGTHFGMVSFTVRGKGFASVTRDDVVQLHLAPDDVDAALAAVPGAEPLTRGATLLGARLPLGALDGQQLNHWVRRAWSARAPRRLAAVVAAADAAEPGEVGDLPAAIGRPATRALAGAGVTTLAEVGARTDAELLALHGVGPRAVRILREHQP
ncbi:MmcQ/YjbR family DNA-binding protein [Isoptericola variabilis]|uniref:MmcQ/YjbR family DNA-binding protein n=1 Tax=Isoptericola variabilis TaxID=139208 RepID=UPI003D1B56EC